MKTRLALVSAALGLAVTAPAGAVEVFSDEAKGMSLNVGALIQPWLVASSPDGVGKGTQGVGAPSGQDGRATGLSIDSYLRRVRILVSGNVSEKVSFYLATDQPNFGKAGSFTGAGSEFSSPLFIQDAFISYEFLPELKLDAGMMVLPFSHHTLEGAASLNTLEYHSDMLRLPTGKHFHDTGVQLRGVIQEKLHYRAGIFEGVRNGGALETPVEPVGASYPDLNPYVPEGAASCSGFSVCGMPRFTGQIRGNILGSESDFFFKGIYFSPKPILSVGVGGDYQPDAVLKLDGKPGRYWAFSADVFAEIPFSAEQEILAKLAFARYAQGWSRIGESNALETGGITLFGELGYRHGWIEPLIFAEYLRAKSSSIIPITIRPHASLATHVGANFFFDQHRFNLKLDVGYRELQQENRAGATLLKQVTYTDLLATAQGQVYF